MNDRPSLTKILFFLGLKTFSWFSTFSNCFIFLFTESSFFLITKHLIHSLPCQFYLQYIFQIHPSLSIFTVTSNLTQHYLLLRLCSDLSTSIPSQVLALFNSPDWCYYFGLCHSLNENVQKCLNGLLKNHR